MTDGRVIALVLEIFSMGINPNVIWLNSVQYICNAHSDDNEKCCKFVNKLIVNKVNKISFSESKCNFLIVYQENLSRIREMFEILSSKSAENRISFSSPTTGTLNHLQG